MNAYDSQIRSAGFQEFAEQHGFNASVAYGAVWVEIPVFHRDQPGKVWVTECEPAPNLRVLKRVLGY